MIKKCISCGKEYEELMLHLNSPGPGLCPRCRSDKRRDVFRRISGVFKRTKKR